MKHKKLIAIVALVAVAALMVAGVAVAAMTLTHHGSVQVVSAPPPATTYTFAVYDAATGGSLVADGDSALFALGSVNAGATSQKTVYLQKTGTGNVTVTPSVSWTGTAPGTITFTPTSVSLTDATRQPIVVTFTAGASPAASTDFDIIYTGSP